MPPCIVPFGLLRWPPGGSVMVTWPGSISPRVMPSRLATGARGNSPARHGAEVVDAGQSGPGASRFRRVRPRHDALVRPVVPQRGPNASGRTPAGVVLAVA